MFKLIPALALAAVVFATGCDDPYVTCDVDASIVGGQIDLPQSGLSDVNGDGVVVLCARP